MSVVWPIKSLLLLFWSKSAFGSLTCCFWTSISKWALLEIQNIKNSYPEDFWVFHRTFGACQDWQWSWRSLSYFNAKIMLHNTNPVLHRSRTKVGVFLFALSCPVLTHQCFTTPRGSSFCCDHFSGSDHYDHITSHLAGLFLYCSAVYTYMHGKANKMLPVKLGGTVKESRKSVWYISLWLPLSVYSLDFSAGMFWFDDITHVLKDCKKPSSDLNFTNLPIFRKLSWKKSLLKVLMGLKMDSHGQLWINAIKLNIIWSYGRFKKYKKKIATNFMWVTEKWSRS